MALGRKGGPRNKEVDGGLSQRVLPLVRRRVMGWGVVMLALLWSPVFVFLFLMTTLCAAT